jgi:tetratricopeptide (TPR) repeat protein
VEQALRHHSAGELQAAEAMYREVLRLEPENADALHLLGVIAYQVGRHGLALKLVRRALDIDPAQARFHNTQGMVLMGRGARREAIAAYERALALQPGFGEAHNNLGNALRAEGRIGDAEACYRRALELNANIPEAHNNLGTVLKLKGEVDGAIACFRRALELRPAYAEALSNLGNALEEADRLEEAEECCRRAIALKPDLAGAHGNLGNVLNKQGNCREALLAHERSIALSPEFAPAHCNMGVVLYTLGRVEEAMASYRRALALDSGYAAAQWGIALAHLIRGEYDPGWKQYEWRWEGCAHLGRGRPRMALAQWRGEPLEGRRILIHAEQGLGDEIMFASILPEIVAESAACLIECSPKLEKLFRRSFPGAAVLGNDRDAPGWEDRIAGWLASLPAVDFVSPIGSLARYRRARLADFPAHRGYLKADRRRVAYWKSRVDKLGRGRKIGVAWRGGLPATGAARRSMSLEQLVPVLRQPGLRFVSLQYGECSEEVARLARETGIEVAHWREAHEDFDETAALAKALDLVLSVCSSVIHLGGALGQRTWVMAPHVPEWRYGLTGEAMPWYPSVRIFRQPEPGNWDEVLGRVRRELRKPRQ